MIANPKRSRRRSRRYHRNPGVMSSGFITDAMYITGGFVATRVVYGMAAPYLSGFVPMDQPIVRILGKGAVAYGLGWAGKRFLGMRVGQMLMIGGMVEALNDAVKTFVAPYVPALADDMSVYPQIGVYPTLSGYDSPQSVSAYDEAV